MTTDSSSSDSRIRQIIREFVDQSQGESPPSVAEFVARFPEFQEQLDVELRRAMMLMNIRQQIHDEPNDSVGQDDPKKLRVTCPECKSSIELEPETSWSSITCSSCKTQFSLVSEAADSDFSITQIGHFDLLDRVGAGSFGTVWRAYDRELDRLAAIKMPRKGQLTPKEIEHFLREARTAAQINHPNIVKVFEVGRFEDGVFIASEFIDGPSLAQRLATREYSFGESAVIVQQLAVALQHAHAAGVIHRDLKPGNILLDHDGQPHIADFGLAKRDAADITMTTSGAVLGTPAFMAPEQAQGLAHLSDARSDIYSLGVILFRLLTGELPFRGSTAALLQQVINDDPPNLRKLNGKIPRDLETICLKCLEKQPERRFTKARDLAEELQRYIANEPIVSRPIRLPERVQRWCVRQPALAGALSLAMFTFVVGTIVASVLSIEAARESKNASMATETANRRIYAADMIRVQRAIEHDNQVQAMGLLRKYLPEPGHNDLRQIEWHYWWRKCNRGFLGHYVGQQRLISIAISPDGERLVWGDDKGHLFASGTGLDDVFKLEQRHQDRVSVVAFAKDGERFVSGGHDGKLLIWSMSTLKVVEERDFGPGKIWHASYWHDNNWLVVGISRPVPDVQENDEQKRQIIVEVLDVEANQIVDAYETVGYYPWLALSPDGVHAAIGDSAIGQSLVMRDIPSNKNKWANKTDKNFFGRSIFTPDGNEILSCYWDFESKNRELFHVFDTNTGALRRELARRQGTSGISQLKYSKDQQWLLVGTGKGGIDVYDADSLSWSMTLTGHTNRVSDLAISESDGTVVSVGDDYSVRRWDLELAKNPMHIELDDNANDLSFDSSLNLFAISNQSLNRSHISTGLIRTDTQQYGQSLALSKNEESIFFVRKSTATDQGPSFQLFECDKDLKSSKLLARFDRPFQTVDVLPGGDLVLRELHRTRFSLDCPAALAIFSLKDNEIVREFGGANGEDTHQMSVSGWALSPDKKWLATCSRDRSVRLWDYQSGRQIYSASRPNTINPVHSLDISSLGLLATGEADGVIVLRKLETGELISKIFAHDKGVSFVRFTKDGQTLISGSQDSTIKFWDAASGQLRTELAGGEYPFAAFALAPNESYLAACDSTGRVLVWDLSPVTSADLPGL